MHSIVSPHIRWINQSGSVILLNIESGEYLGLSGKLARCWLQLAGMASETGANLDESTASFQESVAELERRGLLTDTNPIVDGDIGIAPISIALQEADLQEQAGRRMIRLPLVVDALISIRSTSRILAAGKFSALHATLQRECLLPRIRQTRSAESVVKAFSLAEPMTPLRFSEDDCLLRSAALCRLLWRAGHAASHIIGVRLHPFAAHAWVEIDGRPILDGAARIAQFQPILVSSA